LAGRATTAIISAMWPSRSSRMASVIDTVVLAAARVLHHGPGVREYASRCWPSLACACPGARRAPARHRPARHVSVLTVHLLDHDGRPVRSRACRCAGVRAAAGPVR
jgi:hypothetical protein